MALRLERWNALLAHAYAASPRRRELPRRRARRPRSTCAPRAAGRAAVSRRARRRVGAAARPRACCATSTPPTSRSACAARSRACCGASSPEERVVSRCSARMAARGAARRRDLRGGRGRPRARSGRPPLVVLLACAAIAAARPGTACARASRRTGWSSRWLLAALEPLVLWLGGSVFAYMVGASFFRGPRDADGLRRGAAHHRLRLRAGAAARAGGRAAARRSASSLDAAGARLDASPRWSWRCARRSTSTRRARSAPSASPRCSCGSCCGGSSRCLLARRRSPAVARLRSPAARCAQRYAGVPEHRADRAAARRGACGSASRWSALERSSVPVSSARPRRARAASGARPRS